MALLPTQNSHRVSRRISRSPALDPDEDLFTPGRTQALKVLPLQLDLLPVLFCLRQVP